MSGQLPVHRLYIGGEWIAPAAGETFPTFNPFDQQPWAMVSQAGAEDVARAVAVARETFEKTWSKTSGLERATLMHRLADLLERDADRMGTLESTDNGKIVRETRSQMKFVARTFRFFAGYADKLYGKVIPLDRRDVFDYATLEPLGVIGLITAWNSPIALLGNKLPAALAAGNTVVVKPSEHASVTTLEFARLVEEAGFPAGVFNVVTGDARTGQALVQGGGLDKISFTGSGVGGRAIAAAAGQNLTPVVLELGGKSPNIIFADADIGKATTGALAGIFAATGQTCIAGSRALIHRPIHDQFVEKLLDLAKTARMGNPLEMTTQVGPVTTQPQYQKVLDYIRIAKDEGAVCRLGGSPATRPECGTGWFVEPTIFTGVDPKMRIANEEVFGPVLSVIPFDDEEEAIRIANGTVYGLAAGVWTKSIRRALTMSERLEAGTVWVNTYRAVSYMSPFGGYKRSGIGRESGIDAIREYLQTKSVWIDIAGNAPNPFVLR